MTSIRKEPQQLPRLVEPQKALQVYLDALLCEVVFTIEEEDNQAQTSTIEPEIQVKHENVTISEAKSPPVDTAESINLVREIPADKKPADIVNPATVSKSSSAKIDTPEWGQKRFQCLCFQVAGITLASPLEKLHGIIELEEEITELPGYAPWVMGLLPNRGQNVQVVDIAQVIMPAGRKEKILPASERVKYVVLIDEGRFGLAVDKLSQVLTLEPGDVHWRNEHSKRPWLAGTVMEKMCAVLDIDQLIDQLSRGLTDINHIQ